MKDWKKIASGNGLEIPDADIERIAPALDSLESAFRPLTGRIPGEIEPAVIFQAEEDAQ